MKRFLVVTCVLLLCLCLLPAGVADAPAQELTILFTHDLHSHVDTIAAKDGSEIGGFAKLKTVIDSVRAQDDAVLVVDAGDFAMGTLYQSVYAEEALELRLLGAMGFDATTYGNHEFDYGSNKLAEMLLSAKASGEPLPQLLVSNINWDGSTGEHTATLKAAMEAYGAKPYTVIERGGVRIALFGLLGKDADECAPTSGLDFADIIESAKQTVATIKQNEQADMIVCLSHSGTDKDPSLSEDELLAAAVPEIDFIVSGHTHTTLANGIRVGDTMIGSVGEYGENIGKAVLQKRADGRWDVTQYALIPIDESIVSDASMLETVAQYRTRICAYLEQFGYTSPDQVIAYSPYTFAADAEL